MHTTATPPNVCITTVAITASRAEEPLLLARLRGFAWDDPPPRVSRPNADVLVVDLAVPVDGGMLTRLEAALGRPVAPVERSAWPWHILGIVDEDG